MSVENTSFSGREYSMGDVARLLGVSRSWVKNREENGTLPQPRRTPGGHRTYNTQELHQIRDLALAAGLRLPESPALPSEFPERGVHLIRSKIAVLNQKGGPGKTTLAQNLAFALGGKGFRCLLVDLDSQGSLSLSCGFNILDEENQIIGTALRRAVQGEEDPEFLREYVRPTYHPHVDLIPGNEATLEAQMHIEQQRAISVFHLRRCLDPVAEAYDFVFIDCPPNLGTLSITGLVASDYVLVPIDYKLSIYTINHLKQTIRDVQRAYNNKIDILGIVMNKFDARTSNSKRLEELLIKSLPNLLFNARIPQTSKVQDSQDAGQAIVDYEPRHTASHRFNELADEVVERLRSLSRNGGLA